MDDFTNYNKTDAIKETEPLVQDRTIAALFADEGVAKQAENALEAAGFSDVDVTRNTEEAADGTPVHAHSFWDKVKSFFAGEDDAHTYGEGVRRGHTLVTVHAEQGRAAAAVEILDRFDPIDIEGAEQAWRSEGWSAETSDDANAVVGENPYAGNARVRSYVRQAPIGEQDPFGEDSIDGDEKPIDPLFR